MTQASYKTYTIASLSAELRNFEARYGISSEEHIRLRQLDQLPDGITNFDSHVWAAFTHDVIRMRAAQEQETTDPLPPAPTPMPGPSGLPHVGPSGLR